MAKEWVYIDADEVRPCDFCNMPAHVDGVTSLAGHLWANMCFKHWEINGYYKKLGLGIGQLLIVRDKERPSHIGHTMMEKYSSADTEQLRSMAERNDQPMRGKEPLYKKDALFGEDE